MTTAVLTAQKPRKKFKLTKRVFSYPYVLFMLLFVVLPLVMILVNAFLDSDNNLTLENFKTFFSESSSLIVLGNSVFVGLVTTALCLLIGYPVAYCIAHSTVLEKLPLETFRTFSDLFDDGVYAAIDLTNCVTRRVSYGGTSVPSVEAQIAWVTQQLEA